MARPSSKPQKLTIEEIRDIFTKVAEFDEEDRWRTFEAKDVEQDVKISLSESGFIKIRKEYVGGHIHESSYDVSNGCDSSKSPNLLFIATALEAALDKFHNSIAKPGLKPDPSGSAKLEKITTKLSIEEIKVIFSAVAESGSSSFKFKEGDFMKKISLKGSFVEIENISGGKEVSKCDVSNGLNFAENPYIAKILEVAILGKTRESLSDFLINGFVASRRESHA